jgi:hypothetical protein
MIPRHTPDRGGGPRPYYICNSYSNKDIRCSAARHYAAEKLEAEVASKLDKWFSDPDRHTRYLMERLEAERRKLLSGDPETQARALSERVAKLDRMKSNYRRQQAEDVIDMGELKAVLADLDSQQQAAKTELDNLLNRATRIEDMQRETKTVLDYFAALSQMGLEHLTPELRKGVYRKLRIQVTVEPDGSITIAGEPDVNYFPEVGEVDQATIEAAKEEAEQLARIVERSEGVLQSESHELA